jgi:hypothetical protein
MFPIHVGVPPLHKRNKNQMCAEERIMKDMLEEMMEKTPPVDIEKAHAVSQQKRKRSPSRNDSQNSGSLRNVVDMEIDNAMMPDWVALRIVESQ